MFTRYIAKYIRRGGVTNALFCLLLALAGALLCVSSGLWYSAYKAMRDIDKTITTIALPDSFAISNYAQNAGGGVTKEDVMASIRERVYASGLFKMDSRRFFGGYAPGVSPVPLRIGGFGISAAVTEASSQSLAALAVTCERIEFRTEYMGLNELPDGPFAPYFRRYAEARFTVDEVFRLNPAFTKPPYIDITFQYMNPGGGVPVEIGRQYVAVGGYTRRAMNLSFDGVAGYAEAEPIKTVEELDFEMQRFFYLLYKFPWDGLSRDVFEPFLPVEVWEMRIEDNAYGGGYSINPIEDVNLDDTLKTAEINQNSLYVLTTDDPNSLMRLNQRRDYLTEGRAFTAAEVENGSRVCLISTRLAEQNGLSVGDTLPLQMYASVLGRVTATVPLSDEGPFVTRSFWTPSQYRTDLSLTEPEDYTVVGIYEILRVEVGDYGFPLNTVIIPDAAFAGVGGRPLSPYYVPDYPPPLLGDAMIAPNGKKAETKALLDSISDGYGNIFKFYDQGYAALMNTLGNMRFGTAWILALASVVWLIVTAIFSLFYISRKRRETELLHAVGVGLGKRFLWVFVQCAVVIVAANALALAVTMPLYGNVIDTATRMAAAFTESLRDMTLSDAVEAGVRRELLLDKSPSALIFTAVSASALLLAVAGYFSARAAAFKALNTGREEN